MEGKMTSSKIGKNLWKCPSHISSISLEKTISSLHFLCCSISKSCLTLCRCMDCSMPGFPVLHCLPEFAKFVSIELVMPSNHFILYCPLLLPSIFPSIRVFSSESALHIRWPRYWSFRFSIGPSNEYSGLISFRMDWLDLFAVQGTLKSLLQHHNSKASILWRSAFFIVPTLASIRDYWKNHRLD